MLMKQKVLSMLALLLVAATGAVAETETLLTTITATGKEQANYSTANVATVSFSYTAGGSSAYLANWGWWGYGWSATVNAAEGYTITKCIFYDDANRTATDSEAPFVVETTEEDKTPKVNGTPILAYTSKGIKKIEVYGYATLADNADNSTLISTLAANGGTWNVTLQGRTLQAGNWNTFAVPFSADIPDGWTVMKLTGAEDNGSTITLTFGDATSIEAGKPYLVQVPSNVANPVFSNVTVNSTANPATFANVISFVPTFGLTALPVGKENILFLAAGNTLKHPSAEGQNLKGFRAYFQLLNDVSQARAFRLNLGEKVTGVEAVSGERIAVSGATYNLSGQKVSDDYKGIVIKNGKKIVVH